MKILVLILVNLVICYGFQTSGQDKNNDSNNSPVVQSGDSKLKKINEKDYIVYTVKSGDTWFGISKKFGITYPELRLANKDEDDKLRVGREIFIPPAKLKSNDAYYKKKYIDSVTVKKPLTDDMTFHTVKKSQTLFSISILYGVTVGQIKEWNNLESNSISIGQKLIVGKRPDSSPGRKKTESSEIVPDKIESPVKVVEVKKDPPAKIEEEFVEKEPAVNEIVKDETPLTPIKPIEDVSREKITFANGRQEVNENGIAGWMVDEGNNSDKLKYYGLHRTAPVGTIIRVLNLSNSRKIYVKVTGQLPETVDNENIIIRISKACAETLGVSEKNFQANLLFGMSKD